jgi:large subunit ribosomal protein L9
MQVVDKESVMEVILLKPVRKLGKIGDLVSVKDGFGRNFLVPQKIAVRATDSNRQMIAEKRQEFEAKNAEAKAQAEVLAKKIEDKDFVFIRQAAADGRLFGSVAGKEIAAIVSEAGYEISHAHVVLDKPIKTLGVYKVTLALHTEVSSYVIINVSRSASEAIEALRDFREGKVLASESQEEDLEEVAVEAEENEAESSEGAEAA